MRVKYRLWRILRENGLDWEKMFSLFITNGTAGSSTALTKITGVLVSQFINILQICKVELIARYATINMEWRGGAFGFEGPIAILVDRTAREIV